MTKINIVSQRLRNTKLSETEAQRRARTREWNAVDESHPPRMDELNSLLGTLSLELPELVVDDLLEAMPSAEPYNSQEAPDGLDNTARKTSEVTVRLELTPEQSQIMKALSQLVKNQQHDMKSLTLNLAESEEHCRTVLQFSLHSENVPEMISLQELCLQLKVGRRSVLRLIREGQLRCYRIGRRYRFAASDVKQYLDQNSLE